MIRQWLRLALPLVIGFTLYSFLIRAQPDADSDLRALFTPSPDCPAPCFIGIQPGVTTVADAVIILKANPWVKNVDSRFDPATKAGFLILTWSGAQPSFINTQAESALHICGNLICSLSIATNVEFGTLLLAFGQPDSATLRSFPDDERTWVVQTATYDLLKFNARTIAYCPPIFTAMALHHSLTTIQIGIARDPISSSANMGMSRYQIINFQKRPYSWLMRRAFVCPT